MNEPLPTFQEALAALVEDGCSCDLLNGWVCGVHAKALTVAAAHDRELKAAVDRLFDMDQ